MKKIIFNGEYYASQDEPSGIARVTFEILEEMDKIVNPGEVEILAPRCGFDKSKFHNIKFVQRGTYGPKDNERIKRLCRLLWKYVTFPMYCRTRIGGSITVNTSLVWKMFPFDVMSIYDCTHDLFPQFVAPESRDWYDKLTANQLKNCPKAKLILTDSFCARKDISKLYHVEENKIMVIPCGWQHFKRINEDDTVIDRFGLTNKEYFFSLGSRFPHKNIKWVNFAATKNPQYKFVVTGSTQGRKDTSFEGDIPDNMIFTGYLKDEEIKSLMRHCKAFIQPSFYEGFGIPPMEAMSLGADCIVSTGGSLPEVYKDSVWYIDPYDYENIDLDEIMSRPKASNELILNEYSWEKSAKMLLDTLRNM